MGVLNFPVLLVIPAYRTLGIDDVGLRKMKERIRAPLEGMLGHLREHWDLATCLEDEQICL